TDKQIFFVAAAPKDYINNVIKTVKKAGVSIKEIVASSSALISASDVKDPDPCALVYIGKNATSIVLMKQGQAVFAREVAVGGDNITCALVGEVQTEAGKLEFDYAKAEEIKNNFGIPMNPDEYAKESSLPPAEIMAMMRPALEKIGVEIQRTLAYYHEISGDQTEISKAYFTGGASKIKNFIAYFSAVLGIAILPMPLSVQGAMQNFENDAPDISLAIGAALFKKPFLSLLPEEFKRNYFAIVKKHLDVLIGVALILALVILYARSLSQHNKLAEELKSLQAALRQREGAVAQEAALSASFAKEFGSKKTTDRFVKVVGAIHRLTPSEIYLVKMNYVRATNQFIIQAITVKEGGKSIVKNFLDRLKANPLFATIDLSYMTESNAYTVSTYDFEVRCVLGGETVK
ncbi:MAG TPA: pilus assembly protein PilM, partial [Patescibacteria group bacterium]|nr:pilus assembly protein PilM [Patescibacteria group bacterium]